jgi:hypothetical protein
VNHTISRVLRWFFQATALVLGVFLVAFVGIAMALYSDARWLPSMRWLGLAAYTIFLCVAVTRPFRPQWNQYSFWLSLAALLCCHFALCAFVLLHVAEWHLIWFAPLTLAEIRLCIYVMYQLGYVGRHGGGRAAGGTVRGESQR